MSFFSAFYQVSPSAITKTIGIIAIPEHQLTGKTEYFLTNINLASIANTWSIFGEWNQEKKNLFQL